MMRRSEQKAHTRRRIVDAATRHLRRYGVQGTTVAPVMKSIGLTVGGFYNHFPSKSALVIEALRQGMAEHRAYLESPDELGRPPSITTIIDRALRTASDPQYLGCPLPAMLSDLPRSDELIRTAVQDELEALVQWFSDLLSPGEPDLARSQALMLVTLMIGGIALSQGLPQAGLGEELNSILVQEAQQHA